MVSYIASNLSHLQKTAIKNHKATRITVISVLEIGRIEKTLEIGNVNDLKIFK